MKRSLQLKVWILLAYVLLCTLAVLDAQCDAPAPSGTASMVDDNGEAP